VHGQTVVRRIQSRPIYPPVDIHRSAGLPDFLARLILSVCQKVCRIENLETDSGFPDDVNAMRRFRAGNPGIDHTVIALTASGRVHYLFQL
jgi:hypothetical protein